MPPIMGAAAFIMAEYANIPYSEVVKAALIPALISITSLFCITHLEAAKHKIKKLSAEHIPEFFKTLLGGLHYLTVMGVLAL